ncbi:hypothetical protein AVEN_155009-1 [Araneus ventricosus]|uniref:V(D)J recombination-activating protein 1 RNase H domain-containing protein n=1 Tax=Araneus ventricosus TaxID=182803 RepID=A0A4Y2A797_ARAVE|nr:hypothetical protein AVEN_155009-1 [Araneus ventricosus]
MRGSVFQAQKRSSLSEDQALVLMVDANLSIHQYKVILQQTNKIHKNMYPIYHKIKVAKQLFYPSDVNVTETFGEIKLQSLMDHTIMRLSKVQEDVLKFIRDLRSLDIVKWGCDGVEQSRYKQKFSSKNCSDASLFSISIVPIQIYSVNDQKIKKIVWQNSSPCSTRYCRPVKFLFAEETLNVIKTAEVKRIKEQVSLLPTKISINDMEVSVKPTLIFCMIDGKICNAVAGCESTQTCYLCGAKPSEMNKERITMQKTINRDLLSTGLSPLHTWIRFFECILHLSYRFEIKPRRAENKNKVTENGSNTAHKFFAILKSQLK